jgi:hypothetical protein
LIEALRLQEFQGHRDLAAALDPLVTVFVGESGAGKSSLFRAIRWAALNRPDGDAMVGRWGKARHATVTVTADGRSAQRRRGKDVNAYRLDGEVLKAPGRKGVPRDVAGLLNLGLVNFQGQFDGPFWFGLPPAEVSRRLNAVVSLDRIDASLTAAARDVRRLRAAAEVSRERLAAARGKAKALRWVVAADRKLKRIEGLEQKRAKLANKWARIDSLSEKAAQAAVRLHKLGTAQTVATALASRAAERASLATRLERLEALHRQSQRLTRAATLPDPPTAELAVVYAAAGRLRDRHRRLSSLWLAQANLSHEVKVYDEELAGIESELEVFYRSGTMSDVRSKNARPVAACVADVHAWHQCPGARAEGDGQMDRSPGQILPIKSQTLYAALARTSPC